MKKWILAIISMVMLMPVMAQQVKTPTPSPTQTLKQDFALSTIELTYSRPGMKGRKIFGDLVPYGKVWRTGANNATTLTFADDVTIGGKLIPAGKYGLLTIPDKNAWVIIISKQTDVTSPAAYKPDMDIVRLEAKTQKLDMPLETFTIQFTNIKPTSCDIEVAWENTMVSFPVTEEIDSKIMAQIDQQLNKDNKPYYNAAMYYMENGKDLNQALAWFDKAVEQNPTAYWIQHQRANCLAKLGRKEEARAAAKKSMELARDAKNDDYVRLNEKLLIELK